MNKKQKQQKELEQLIDEQQCDMNCRTARHIPKTTKKKRKKRRCGTQWTSNQIAADGRRKAKIRREYSIRLMKQYKGLYDCKECIHGLIRTCQEPLPNGCEYYSNEITGRKFSRKAVL